MIKEREIVVIGGIAADIEGNPYGQLNMGYSNQGTLAAAYSGSGRNIVENLARLGNTSGFVSVAGNDFVGKGAVTELSAINVDTEHIHLLDGENTAMYLSLLNIVGEMEFALSNTDVYEKISTDMIDKAMELLKNAKMVGLDATASGETIEYVVNKLEGTPLFLDPGSTSKALKLKNIIGKFHTIKPNRKEAEALSGLNILSEDELMAAGKWFEDKGVKRIFITMSGGGVYYKEGMREGIIRPIEISRENTAGSGDAFSAAILDGFVKGMSVEETAKYGMAAASIALESKTPVNPKMDKAEAQKRSKKY